MIMRLAPLDIHAISTGWHLGLVVLLQWLIDGDTSSIVVIASVCAPIMAIVETVLGLPLSKNPLSHLVAFLVVPLLLTCVLHRHALIHAIYVWTGVGISAYGVTHVLSHMCWPHSTRPKFTAPRRALLYDVLRIAVTHLAGRYVTKYAYIGCIACVFMSSHVRIAYIAPSIVLFPILSYWSPERQLVFILITGGLSANLYYIYRRCLVAKCGPPSGSSVSLA